MASASHAGARVWNAAQQLKWSSSERIVARKAFDRALQRALDAVMLEAKKKAEKMREPSDLWKLESYLTESRVHIDLQFDYRYSTLILTLGDLIREGKLSEPELQGLSEDKLALIRDYTALSGRP